MANVHNISNIDTRYFNTSYKFAVDTNVLLWLYYPGISNPLFNENPRRYRVYTEFINDLKESKCQLYTTTLNIAEFCSVVEKKEYKMFLAANGYYDVNSNEDIPNIKQFRKSQREREYYNSIINSSLDVLNKSFNGVEAINLTTTLIDNFSQNILNTLCDPFDYAVIEYLKSIGITNYISDDKDFYTVDGIDLYTFHTSGRRNNRRNNNHRNRNRSRNRNGNVTRNSNTNRENRNTNISNVSTNAENRESSTDNSGTCETMTLF